MMMRRKRTLILLLMCLILVFSSELFVPLSGSSPLKKNVAQDTFFDLTMRMLIFAGYTPSLSACITANSSIRWSQGYGYYTFKGCKQPTLDTIYGVASVSKTITATALLQLYDQGRFQLDDDVNAYLPFSLRNPQYPNVSITFRMLLAHHSSLHDHDEDAAYDYFIGNYSLSYVKELLVPGGKAYHAEFWGDYSPGAGGNYSNLGFVVLGYLVELLSDQTLEQYCSEHIFAPLQMNSTSFILSSLPEERLAGMYRRIGRFYIPLPKIDYTFLDPCGGLFSTCSDLSHFLNAHMNNGTYHGYSLLNTTTIQMMHTIQYPESAPYLGFLRFGLGWLIFEDEFGVPSHGHDGDIWFSHARMRILNNNTTGVIYLYNKGLPFVGRILPSLCESYSDIVIRKILFMKASDLSG